MRVPESTTANIVAVVGLLVHFRNVFQWEAPNAAERRATYTTAYIAENSLLFFMRNPTLVRMEKVTGRIADGLRCAAD